MKYLLLFLVFSCLKIHAKKKFYLIETKQTEPPKNVEEAGDDYGEDLNGEDFGFYVSSNERM